MKRVFCMALIAALLIANLGCAKEQEETASMGFSSGQPVVREGGSRENAARTEAPIQPEIPGQSGEGLEASAQPAAAKTVVGRVDSIIGNEVVLAIGTVDSAAGPGRNAAADSETEAATGPGGRGQGMELPEGMEPPAGMEMPEGMGEMSQGGNMGGGARVNVTYTGETATYLLPVGMAIGTGDFTSVSEGMVLELSFDGEDTITAVSILSR